MSTATLMINITLTPYRYDSAMPDQVNNSAAYRTGGNTQIWLAFLLAFGLHLIILVIPATEKSGDVNDEYRQIEVQLTKSSPPPVEPLEVIEEPEAKPAEPEMQTEPEPVKTVVEAKPVETAPVADTKPLPAINRVPFETLSKTEKSQLAHTILSAQFITEESVADQIFGKQFDIEITDPQPGFHFPLRQDMVSMLDQPMPELPFSYTPGLVYFAYDPGVKGDLQRFWDVITPEFGWRTDNGTEFKCVWVLIIAACGWK